MYNSLIEIFENAKCYIYELATSTNKIKEKVQDFSHPMFTHILKIAYLNEQYPDTINHWSKEVMNWILQCFSSRLKTTNKYPTADQVYGWLFEDYFDTDSLITEYILIKDEYDIEIDQEKSLKLLKDVVKDLLSLRENKELDNLNIIDTILKHKEILK